MARYEEAARLVEDRLRRALRANAIRVLLSSRAKHPDDLRGKLAKNRDDVRYVFSALERGINEIVTDLAGCRVMVYRHSDVSKVEQVVKEALPVADGARAVERHDKPSGYRATHVLVRLGDDEERMSLRGAVCEVQIASLASHVFNELEHDIRYKDHDCPPTVDELESLKEVRYVAWILDRCVERLLIDRARAVQRQTVPLRDAEQLQFMLEQEAGRRLEGEFLRLFRLLDAIIQPLTTAALGSVSELLRRGEQRSTELGIKGADDVVKITLALFDDYADEIAKVVRGQRGPTTMLKKAILQADDVRRKQKGGAADEHSDAEAR